jgi:predicted RNA-binding Zn ribbon-like protein
MGKKERTASTLELVGGRLCLDFANTLSTRIEGKSREYLTDYGQLVSWSRHAGILTGGEAEAILDSAAGRPDLAATALEQAIALRETIYRVFSATADGRGAEGDDLSALNRGLRQALSRLEVVPSEDTFGWSWVVGQYDLDHVLWPVIRSAGDLLTSDDLRRVRRCAREGCDWLFVDLSKNHSRRWCSMNMCGSRVKARRYYRRRRGKEQD